MASTIASTHSIAPGEYRVVPLSSLELRPGFNPRTVRDSAKFAQTVQTVRERGVLQPILVTPDGQPDVYYVVAGEGRYLAAGEAGQVEVPVIVCDVDEKTHGLELAMIENLAREELDPVAEARGFAGLKAAGWTKKGISEFFGVSQKLVTERLQIDELPEELYPGIASGEIPLSAIKPLVALGKIHSGLPQVAAARVGAQRANQWQEPLTWGDVIEDPVGALLVYADGQGTELPSDVYPTGQSFPVDRFTLSEKAAKDLRALCAVLSIEPSEVTVRFGPESIKQARSLNALYASKDNWHFVVVGQAVADQLAGDCIATSLKAQRASARREREEAKQREREAGERGESSHSDDEPAVVTEEQLQEQKRREREQERETREKAVAFNLELGAAVFKNLSRVKVEERVLKVLTVFDVHGQLEGIAARGARYGLPGWPEQSQTRSGKTNTDYIYPSAAADKAREYLAGAKSAGEIAGRAFALLVMAHYTDEKCIARSRAAMYGLREHSSTGVPWADEAMGLLEQIAEERLPQHLTASIREERERQAELERAEQRAEQAANELRGRLDEMTVEERLEALRAFGEEHGRHTVVTHWLRQAVQQRNAEDRQRGEEEPPAAEDTNSEEHSSSEEESDSASAPDVEHDGDSPATEESDAPAESESGQAVTDADAENATADETEQVVETV